MFLTNGATRANPQVSRYRFGCRPSALFPHEGPCRVYPRLQSARSTDFLIFPLVSAFWHRNLIFKWNRNRRIEQNNTPGEEFRQGLRRDCGGGLPHICRKARRRRPVTTL